MHDGVDPLVADSPRDQLRVLRTEVENENGLFRLMHARIVTNPGSGYALRVMRYEPITDHP